MLMRCEEALDHRLLGVSHSFGLLKKLMLSFCFRELSGNRYARAQRALGSFYFAKQRVAEAAAAYRLATAANTLHAQSWFALGCCCLGLGEDLEARAAFARVVAIDPEEGDAWANLAAVHCKVSAQPERIGPSMGLNGMFSLLLHPTVRLL